ncbi:FAD binding domain-containing protein [Thermodesulfobacteriota bacterium]
MLRLPAFKHTKAATLDDALSVLANPETGARIFAGGTDLLVNMKHGLAAPGTVVSIGAIPELRSISESGDGTVRIGSCVTLSEIAADRIVADRLPALGDAAAAVASWQIRNVATLGGNLCLDTRCWYYNQSKAWRSAREACYKLGGARCHAIKGSERCHAINSSDTAPILMALDARLIIERSGHKRTLPICDFYRDDGSRHTALEPGELVTFVEVPPGEEGSRAQFVKISTRRGIDFAAGNLAACIRHSSNSCSAARLVIGAMHSAPRLLDNAGRVLRESGLTQQSIEKAAEAARSELGTVTNLFCSAGYKRDLARALTRQALQAYRIKK